MSPPVQMTPGYAPDHIRDERGEESTKREGKRKDREGGGLRKLRLRSRILSHSLFTASHVENRERKGRNKKKGTRRRTRTRRRGAAKRPWQYPKRLSSR